ncbi:MAG: hypothetical protein JJT75_12570 [Opitutales bacterium]|nr:hypothetical protein [Opitutales bacterium]MCH8539384.1 hypothetical protein [Opitutales bacterium]
MASENRIGLSLWWGFRELFRIYVSPLAHALEGSEGWLFLDNDTNHSVEQFRGHRLLENEQLAQWEGYLKELDKLPQTTKIRQVKFLPTPSKEDIYPQFHPHAAGKVRPLLQLRSIGTRYKSYLDPYAFLKACPERVFRKTDTHWNPLGARLASFEISKAMGVECDHSVFAQDQYQENPEIGDLGVRSFPPRMAIEKRLQNFSYAKALLFDNRIQNFGRILITRWEKAVTEHSLLIFGGSSSYFLLDYLSRIFQRVYLVHSAGNIDLALLDLFAPDFLLSQTTGRFILRVPSLHFCFGEVLREKWQNTSSPVKSEAEFHASCLLPRGVDGIVVQKVIRYHAQWLGF